MSQIPSILVTDGWETDQNDILQEVVIPRTVNILQAPNKVTFMGTALNAVPSTVAVLQEFSAPNCVTIPTNCFKGYTQLRNVNLAIASLTASANGGEFYGCTSLQSVTLPEMTSITGNNSSNNQDSGVFFNCISLSSVTMPKLATISIINNNAARGGVFYNCTSLTEVTLPELATISHSSNHANGGGGGTFYNCTSLSSVTLPKLVSTTDANAYNGTFRGCTGLQSVQLGSEGHAVTGLGNYCFSGCTQSGLTITIYTTGGAALSGAPWGATNATIVYEEA